MSKIRRYVHAVLSLVAMLAAGAASAASGPFHGLRVEPPKALRTHTLTDPGGQDAPFPLRRDTWQLVFFGYTHCPDVCPMTLHKTSMLIKELGAEGRRLTPVFISIDSGRDRPEAMGSYIGRFDVPAVGLTGEPESLQAVANEFGVLTRRFQGKTALAYTLQHSSFLYLLDPQGRVQMLYPGTAEIEGIARDLKRLWRGSDPGR